MSKVVPLLLGALLASGVAIESQAAKTTVCTITVNSPNEKDAFRHNLPKDKFEFVELLERGRRDWLASACQQKVQCDVLVISGHFGGDAVVHTESASGFYSDQVGVNDYLPVEEMERVACSESCPGLFSRLKEVYLFGCETLNADALRTTSAEIARTLVQAGQSPADAERVSRALYERFGETNRDRMRRIFANVPVIYGFSSVAPLGPTASGLLNRYFQSASSSEFANGRVSQKLLGAFSAHSMTATNGVVDSSQQTSYRREVCQFFDERLPAAQKLAFIHQVLGRDTAEVRMFFERIEGFLRTLKEDERQAPSFTQALAEISRDQVARERYLVFARKSVSSPIRARMIDVAQALGWLSPEERRAEIVRMIDELMASNAMTFSDVDLMCSLNKDRSLDQEFQRLQLSPSDRTMKAAGLACLGSADGRARVLQALTSPREEDVQTAQVYLRHRPITEANDLRAVANGIARMPRSAAQVRALEALAQQRVSDRESLDELARLFPVADSVGVQRAIAGIFIRSDYAAIDKPALVRVLRQNRLKSPDGQDVIDALIRRLTVAISASDVSYTQLTRGPTDNGRIER
jgi:hypothetical protein